MDIINWWYGIIDSWFGVTITIGVIAMVGGALYSIVTSVFRRGSNSEDRSRKR